MPRPRLLPALALAGALVAGGCQNPDGSTDWGSTLLVGAGVGLAAAAIAGAAADDGPKYRGSDRRYRPAYAHGPRYGHYGRHDGWGRW